MDVNRALRELYDEKRRLDAAIARLELRLRGRVPPSRRGRKSMGPEERLEVSRRMTRYWEMRRAGMRSREAPAAGGPSAASNAQ